MVVNEWVNYELQLPKQSLESSSFSKFSPTIALSIQTSAQYERDYDPSQ